MFGVLLRVFVFSFLLNLLWEVVHSQLYTTCLRLPLRKYIPLIVGASLKDGLWISLFFLVTVVLFGSVDILSNHFQLVVFLVLALVFSFVVEKIALRTNRWEYARQMPTILGVGVTPLLELAVTGLVTFLFVL